MSYKIVIVEDEPPAAKRLTKMLRVIKPEIEIIATLDSVESSVEYFSTEVEVDLIMMDIQLGDGLSFEIFGQIMVPAPVIFTTAYDEYTIQAFKVNSIDYLLKPIESEELEGAFAQFETHVASNTKGEPTLLKDLLLSLQEQKYKERFLIKKRKTLHIVNTSDIAYFHAADGYTHITTSEGQNYVIDHTMDQIETLMDPKCFFRVNRSMIIHIDSIVKVHDYFNSRYKLELRPFSKFESVVARERAKKFKLWLAG